MATVPRASISKTQEAKYMEAQSPTGSAPVATRPTRQVFTVIERDGLRTFWLRIGSAWTNRDGSLTVRLDALPCNGTLQIRDPDDRREPRSTP